MTIRDDRRLAAAVLAASLSGWLVACSGGGSNGGGTGGGGNGGGTGGSTPPTVTALAVNPAAVTGGAASQGTVTIAPAPTVGTAVSLTSDNASATVPGTITVNSGATTASFDITTGAVSAATQVTLRASLNSTTQSAVLTLNPPSLAAVVKVVSRSQAKRKQGNTTVDIPGKPAGSLNTCPLVNDGNGQRLDCEIDASGSTSPNGFRNFRYKWRLATIDGDSGNTTANKYLPAVQNCGFFGGQDSNNNQFLNMRVTVEITSNSGATVTGTVDGVSVFPAGLCGYAF
jgi:hypothetical protein